MEEFTNFLDVLGTRAKERPDFSPLIYLNSGDDKLNSITYFELEKKAQLFAANLQRICAKGDRIIICLPQGIEFFISFFGCMYAGIIAVPAFPPANIRTKERLTGIFNDCKASFILMDHSTAKYFSKRYPGEYEGEILKLEELLKPAEVY